MPRKAQYTETAGAQYDSRPILMAAEAFYKVPVVFSELSNHHYHPCIFYQ